MEVLLVLSTTDKTLWSHAHSLSTYLVNYVKHLSIEEMEQQRVIHRVMPMCQGEVKK